jgi:predicted house-cleaning noncanonical NTP pyrophosphatase (MazG superfamily)
MTELIPAPAGYAIKLVRDNTPAIINSTGEPGELFYRELDLTTADGWGEYLERLVEKIGEETTEVLMSNGQSEDEIVDLYIAVMALVDANEIDLVGALIDDKRGGFAKGVVMYGRHKEFDR